MSEQKFKVGDRVTYTGEGWTGELTAESGGRFAIRFDDRTYDCSWYGAHELELVRTPTADPILGDEHLHEQMKREAALRFNKGKPESDYILTYDGGIEAVFDPEFEYYETMKLLAELYRAPKIESYHWRNLLVALRHDAEAACDDIVELLALTNTLGGIKYEPGNYLKGANWRQYFQSAVRHAISIRDGVEYEYDLVLVERAKAKGIYSTSNYEMFDRGFPMRGNFFFNILALVHCVRNNLGTDDRIKVTK